LPGGDFAVGTLDAELATRYPWMPAGLLARLAQAYGTRVAQIIGAAKSLDQLGQHFGAGLYEAEVSYLRDHEFAQTADDIVWRRSKLGLRMSTAEMAELEAWTPLRQAA
jgi:glycerol-3-phosphate dehydrogenase